MNQHGHAPQPVNGQQLSILLFCDNSLSNANTVLDHIHAFAHFSRHRIRLFNPRGVTGSHLLDLNEFDAVVIHYSINIIDDQYLSQDFVDKLKHFQGLKIQIIQDDYRQVNRHIACMKEIGIQVLFTSYPTEQIPKVWREDLLPGVVKLTALTGYIPDRLVNFPVVSLEDRPIDVGYRGRTIPFWLGEFGQEKIRIGQDFLKHAKKYGLRCDIGWREEDRIYGKRWDQFLASCKASLGTESGASITDFDGAIEQQVREYLVEHPIANFEEVQQAVLGPHENNVPIRVISPRMFEAIATRTALILFPGKYSGILKPWEHYIPLEKDFSNMDEVVEKLRDMDFLAHMVERTYADVVISGRWSYRTFVEEFDRIVAACGWTRPQRRQVRFQFAQAERRLNLVGSALIRYGSLLPLAISTLIFALTTPVIRRIAIRYWHNRKSLRLVSLVKDLLLLNVAKQTQNGKPIMAESISIEAHLDSAKKVLRLVSRRVQGNAPSGISVWQSIEDALMNGKVTRMVWDHSDVGEIVVCHLAGGFKVGIKTNNKGFHHFDTIAGLAHQQ